MDTGVPGYSHTQKAPLYLFLYGTAIALCVGSFFAHDQFLIALILGGSVLMLFLGMAFDHLMVEDQGDTLAIRFGPLPLFRRAVRYADIMKERLGARFS